MGEEPPKKDLTSLIELSALEMAKHPLPPGGEDPSMTQTPIEKVTEADFGNLEDLSKAAAAAAANEPPPPPDKIELPPEQLAELQAAVETPPGEAPATAGIAPGLTELPAAAPAADATGASSIDLPSHSQMGAQDPMQALPPEQAMGDIPGLTPSEPIALGEPMAVTAPDATASSAIHSVEGPPSAPISMGAPTPAPASTPEPEPPAPVEASAAMGTAASVPPAAPRQPLDPNRPPVTAPPAGASHTVKSGDPSAQKQDLAQLKKFGEKLAIGRPKIEGVPAFSLLVNSPTGAFDDKTRKAIEDALGSEDFGIRIEDVAVQLTAGKLLVPQISEFAAITLAQKLRDVVDTIEVDLATEIFKSASGEVIAADDSFLMDVEEFETQNREEVHDLAAEPRNENDLFSSNLAEIAEYQITRILSAVVASEIINAEVAENPTSKEFEQATEHLTQELIKRAFKLGAHGVLGINFTMRAIEGYKDATGKVRRAYRLLGSGTAVRARKRETPAP